MINKTKKLILIMFTLCCVVVNAEVQLRPSEWAQPVIGASLNNFYALDEKVFRSEQPNSESFAQLEAFGIKEVLNLRYFHNDLDEAEKTHLTLQHVRMDAGEVTTEQLIQALTIIRDSKGPIVMHCWHGSDRTGFVSAGYRIVFQDWSKEKAIQELTEGGYGYHASIYPNIIDSVNALDVAALRKRLGLTIK